MPKLKVNADSETQFSNMLNSFSYFKNIVKFFLEKKSKLTYFPEVVYHTPMPKLNLKPNHRAIRDYYATLQQYATTQHHTRKRGQFSF